MEGRAAGYAEPSASKKHQRGDLGEHKNLPDMSGCAFVLARSGTKEGDVKEHDEERAERQAYGKKGGGAAENFACVRVGTH
jgi:hypothetical protein